MIVFTDIFSDSELFSDARAIKTEDDHYFFEAMFVQRSAGGIDDKLIGGNASAEEQQEQVEDSVQSGLDFFLDNRLMETGYGKKEFQIYIKAYLKRLQTKLFGDAGENDPEVKAFKTRATTFFKFILQQFKELNIYFGEQDGDFEGTCCFAKFHDDGKKADIWIFKDGVKTVKY